MKLPDSGNSSVANQNRTTVSLWRLNVYIDINNNNDFVVFPGIEFLCSMFTIAGDDSKNTCAQYLVTNDTNTATLGDLSHIINLETETICIKFESATGEPFNQHNAFIHF